jgi:two-component sensor histidine kinase
VRRLIPFPVLLLLLLLAQLSLCGQELPMLHFTVDDGLPSNTVYETFRDAKGYLWIATDKGIARYNGIRFETYTTSNGLPDNEILFFKEDNQQRIWMATYNGTLGFIRHNTIHTAANTAFLNLPIQTSYTTSIALEQDSSITISFFDKSRFLNIKDDRCTVFSFDTSIDKSIIEDIVYKKKISGNRYYILTREAAFVVNNGGAIEKNSMTHFPKKMPLKYTSSHIQEWLLDNDNIYSTDRKLIRRIPALIKIKGARIYQVFLDGNNSFIATNRGIFINDSMQFLSEEQVSNIGKDGKGHYWLSTPNNGLFVINNNLGDKIYNRSYTGEVTNSIYRGDIYFTTQKNDLYKLSEGAPTCLYKPTGNNSDPDNDISDNASLLTKDFKYLLFCRNTITIINDTRSTRPTATTISLRSVVPEASSKALYLSNGNLYVKWRAGIASFDYNDLISKKEAKPCYIFNTRDRIFGAATAPDNSLWFSTIDKVYKIQNGKPIIQPQFKHIAFKNLIFFRNYIIGYTYTNKLMVCSNIDSATVVADSFVKENCIWNKLYKIDDNNILISTNNLYRLLTWQPSANGGDFSIRTIESPFIPVRVDDICAAEHNCYFFKNGTITKIAVSSILAKTAPPTPFFRSVKTTEHIYRVDPELKIPYSGSMNLTINLASLSFFAKRIIYRYSISRDDREYWRTITGDEINLVNPGFGTYTIKVKARSISSDFSEPIVFTLVIQRPWWARWEFILTAAISVVMLVFLAFRLRLRHVLRKREKKHLGEIKYLRAEYKSLNALMNPHFIFNTLNNVQSLINKDEKLSANQYLRIFANLVRQNMHNVSREQIPLQNEIDLISNYLKLEKLRFKDKLNYAINIDEKTDIADITIPPLLIQPLVENSIKHGILPRKASDNFISIDIYEEADALVISVKDNGIGLEASEKKTNKLHSSYGLDNIRKRIEQLSIIQNKKITLSLSEIKDEAGNSEWTVAVIRIFFSESMISFRRPKRKKTTPATR